MEEKPLLPPDQRNYQCSFELALEVASQKLNSINIEEQCRKSDAEFKLIDGKKTAILEYLNRSYRITFPEIDILAIDSQESVQQREKLLLLHYLIQAKGSPVTGTKITYKEIPDGVTYFPTFYKRSIKPLLDNFGQEPYRLLGAASKLGGIKSDYGDISVTINAFKRVPLTLVLWYGDDELVPEGSILFDSNICDYLPVEDITVLCETITWRLVKISRAK